MKKIILATLMALLSITAFAGQKAIKSDGTVVYWEDRTEVIKWNDYGVVIKLTGKCVENVVGSVSLNGQPSKNFCIPAGQTETVVTFDNLENGVRYDVSVSLLNDTK